MNRIKKSYNDLNQFFKLIRVHQWVKNFFIFLPMFFNKQLFAVEDVWMSIIAFFSFSFLASAIYCLNDIIDVEYDRLHTVKRNRPIASGRISKERAKTYMVLLSFLGFFLSLFGTENLIYVLGLYFIINIWYSFRAKNIAYLDIFLISISFIIRILAGSVSTDTPLSIWILMLVFLLALFLAILKRKDELRLYNKGVIVRGSLNNYSMNVINKIVKLLVVMILGVYVLYLFYSPFIIALDTPYVFITIIFVFLGVYRYLYIVEKEERYANPTSILLSDFWIKLIVLAWFINFYVLIYLR